MVRTTASTHDCARTRGIVHCEAAVTHDHAAGVVVTQVAAVTLAEDSVEQAAVQYSAHGQICQEQHQQPSAISENQNL